MGVLDQLLSNEKVRGAVDDFIARYEQGPPAEGISDEETLRHHDELTADLSPQEYEQAARESFDRLEPQQRVEIGRELRKRGQASGVDVSAVPDDDESLRDPGILGELAGRLKEKQPGGLGAVLGNGKAGGLGSYLNNPSARAVLAGIAAAAVKKLARR
jgi:hypothetical protein